MESEPVAQISNLAFPEMTTIELELVAQPSYFLIEKMGNSFKSPQPPLLKGEKAGVQTYSPFEKGGRGDFGRNIITQNLDQKKVARVQSTGLAKIESWATKSSIKKKRRGTNLATSDKAKIESWTTADDVKITDVRVSNISSSSVTISWVTDSITDGRVRYGLALEPFSSFEMLRRLRTGLKGKLREGTTPELVWKLLMKEGWMTCIG
jgi:hypothetical protein